MSQSEKTYRVYVTLYHGFTVEAENEEEARKKAADVLWDDHLKDCIIDIEEDIS